MKMNNKILVAILFVALTGCGGGGAGSQTTPDVPVVVVPPVVVPPVVVPPVSANPIDPYTNLPTNGSAISVLNGIVFNTNGAIVNAYVVQADGANGALVGTSQPSDMSGKFQIQFSKIPSGMLRLVSAGGSTISLVDNAKQENVGLEIVIPYLTSDTDNLVITPLTSIISHLVSYKAKEGATLNSAFIASNNTVLSISSPNIILKDDTRIGMSLLKTYPGSLADTNSTYIDVLKAFEWFGVRYDLPSKTVTRVLSSYSENAFPLSGVNGKNISINVGKWVGAGFDDSYPFVLDELTAQKNADGTNIIVGGIVIHEYVKNYIATDLIQYFYRNSACLSDDKAASLFSRYPNDAGLFSDPILKKTVCDNISKQITDLNDRIKTNNRSKIIG
ncbi:hypothetical protein JAB4_059440 (plasmid) [Janthinobacterium sp. HH102]|uniref:hypothetical protein n=1 Tax=Janthinobacterium sp. HH102 TaxID=1537274 RepID=UPI0008939B76|nr:hypothetical protein [Janthinobacterium sp. HH102]QOU76444.1 hypothetical protein JAB4_059440 [Janthinobacterium sp. HH102]